MRQTMRRRRFLQKAALAAGALAISPLAARSGTTGPGRPNILVILTDDIGWGDFRCYNPQSKIPSPNLDRLAKEGMCFTNAHTPAALCAPTRYSMVTGNYPWRGRNASGTWGFNVPCHLRFNQKTVAALLQTAGYRTAMFGKAGFGGFYDLKDGKVRGHGEPLAPIRWGFDYSYLIPRGHQAPPRAFFENGVLVGEPLKGATASYWDFSRVGECLAEKAIAFLDRHLAQCKAEGRDSPFFMHFCTDGAHGPYVPGESLMGTPLKGVTKMTDHTDMVYETDILLGKLMEALEKRDLLGNTLVVFTSDNGGLPFEREFGHDAVGGLRGRKSYIFEGGHRVPFVARWGDGTPHGWKVPPGTIRRQVIGAHDVVATALDPEDQALDSVSLVPVLLGRQDDSQPVRRNLLVQSSPGRDAFDDGGFSNADVKMSASEEARKKKGKQGGRPRGMAHALIEGDWKLVIDSADKPAALYDLDADLAEQTNLIDQPAQADRVKRMYAAYREIRSSRRSVPVR